MHTSIIEVGLEGARDERERKCGGEEDWDGEGAPSHLHLCSHLCRHIDRYISRVRTPLRTDSAYSFSSERVVIRASGRKHSAACMYSNGTGLFPHFLTCP